MLKSYGIKNIEICIPTSKYFDFNMIYSSIPVVTQISFFQIEP